MLRASGRGAALEIETGHDWNEVGRQRERIGAELRTARATLGDGGECDLPMASAFLQVVNDTGRAALQRLLGPKLPVLREYLGDGVHSGWSGAIGTVDWPMIEVQMPAVDFLQVEVLPFAHRGELPPIDSEEDLRRAAARFPGFSFVTRRVRPNQTPQDNVLKGRPRVPLKMFYHARFAGARDEASFLKKQFDFEGPWPGTGTAHQSAGQAIRTIVDCHRDLTGAGKPVIDQVHHFSCHCGRGGTRLPDSFLELCSEGGRPFKVPLSDFDRGVEAATTDYERPLAFLNACETSSRRREDYSSWAFSLTQASYRGVIGTEVPAPDIFAAAFSQEFYAALLEGRTVGQALQIAKWKLLDRWKNPLGLLYTYFGNPDLHVQ